MNAGLLDRTVLSGDEAAVPRTAGGLSDCSLRLGGPSVSTSSSAKQGHARSGPSPPLYETASLKGLKFSDLLLEIVTM